MTRLEVPTVNFSKLHEASERQKLDLACREFGFFALTEHGISKQLQTDLAEAMASYFAQPEAYKLQQERTEVNPFGFYNQELTKNRLDQKEIFDISLTETTLWPDNPAFVATTSE